MKGTKPHLVVVNGSEAIFPDVPSWLSSEAQKEWRRIRPFLEERKILTDLDFSNFENYCVAQGRVRECEAIMSGINDIDHRSKVWRMQNQAMTTAKQLAAELGLTPMSRSRPMMRQGSLFEDEEDPLNVS